MAEYEILGTVVERGTRKGVPNLHVEAWDRDTRFHDMLGCATTDGAGQFRIRFTDEYFGDYGGDLTPDIFYRVYRDDTLVLSTQEKPAENQQPGRIRVTLEVEPLVEPEARPDRVDAETAIKALRFFRESDFRGIQRDAAGRARMAGGALGKILGAAFREWDWKPVRPDPVSHSDVAGQDVERVRTRLAEEDIVVDRVEPFQPGLDRRSGRMLSSVPPRLDKGERVVLYEEDGQVRYYATVRDEPAATIDQAEVRRLSQEMATVRTEVSHVANLREEVVQLKSAAEEERASATGGLSEVREQVSEIAELRAALAQLRTDLNQRDQTIATLHSELKTVKESQERIEGSDLPQRLGRLETDVRRFRPG